MVRDVARMEECGHYEVLTLLSDTTGTSFLIVLCKVTESLCYVHLSISAGPGGRFGTLTSVVHIQGTAVP